MECDVEFPLIREKGYNSSRKTATFFKEVDGLRSTHESSQVTPVKEFLQLTQRLRRLVCIIPIILKNISLEYKFKKKNCDVSQTPGIKIVLMLS